jgi:O-antigen ligase
MAVVGALLLGTAFAALKLYGTAAESGSLGDKAREKYEAQSALGDLGLILGGRSEWLVTLEAIRDSPLFGHGSWAKDQYYAERRQVLLYQLGFTDSVREPKDDLIPTHSHLLGAWVEAGFGGVIFWLGILALIAAALRRLYASDDPLRPYLVFVMFLFIWDILFSPFGAQRRLTNGFFMVVVLFALKTEHMDWRRRIAAIAPYAPHREWAITQPLDPRLQPTEALPPFLRPEDASDFDDMPAQYAADQHVDQGEPATGPDVDGEAIRAGFRRMRQQRR